MTNPVTFVTGGAVQAGGGVYLERSADQQLLDLCRAGSFAYILSSRQVGKSSLTVRTAERLQVEGSRSVIIDLNELGVEITSDQWYQGLLLNIADQLLLEVDVSQWWQAHEETGLAQRFSLFLREVVLERIRERVVVFVDEIDSTLRLTFTDDFFAAIRYLYNARASFPALTRLSFVLIGVATPADLIKDPNRTPFNIGQRVDLTDFTLEEILPLMAGLPGSSEQMANIPRWILNWTGGHPFLTMRLFRAVHESRATNWSQGEIDALARNLFFGEQGERDSNLQYVRDMLTRKAFDAEAVLSTYIDVRRGKKVRDEELSQVKSWLKLAGVVCSKRGLLHVRNSIYEQVFTERWAREQLPINWPKQMAQVGKRLLLAVMGLSVPLAWIAWTNWQRADRQMREAQKFKEIALARGLLAQAELLRSTSPDLVDVSALLAIESLHRDRKRLEGVQVLRKDLPLLRTIVSSHRHTAAVSAVGFSQDGRQVISASADDLVVVWDSKTGRELTHLRYEGNGPIAFRPEGERMAAGSVDGVVRVLSLDGGGELLRLGHQGPITVVAFSPDGQRILTGSGERVVRDDSGQELSRHADNAARLWDAVTGKELLRLPHQGPVSGVALSSRGQILTWSGDSPMLDQKGQVVRRYRDNLALLWSVGQGNADQQPIQLNHDRPVRVGLFSPDGARIATGGWDNAARVWDARNGRQIARLNHDRSVTAIAFSPDGRRLVTGSEDNTARLWEIEGTKEVARLNHQAPITCVAFSSDGNLVVTASSDQTARIWDAATGKELARLAHQGPVNAVAMSSDGKHLVTGSGESIVRDRQGQEVTSNADNTARVWELERNEEIRSFSQSETIMALAFGQQQDRVVTINPDAAVNVWSIETGELLAGRRLQSSVSTVSFSQDGQRLVMGGKDGWVRVWDVGTEKEPVQLSRTSTLAVALSPDGRRIATAGTDFSVRLWDETTGQPLASLPHPEAVTAVAFSRDGHRLLSGSVDDKGRIWDSDTHKLLVTLDGHQRDVRAVAFSSDGRYVATGSWDNTARLWDAQTGRELARMSHGGVVNSVAFSSDGRWLASGSQDTTARVWDIETGGEIARLTHDSAVRAVSFCKDGRHLAMADDATVEVSLWKPDDLIRFACQRLTGNFTVQEWKQYLGDEPYRKTCSDLP